MLKLQLNRKEYKVLQILFILSLQIFHSLTNAKSKLLNKALIKFLNIIILYTKN